MANTKWLIGIDEAGRGPLAGPVYVGVYAYPKNKKTTFMRGIKDSKKLSSTMREKWLKEITSNKQAKFTTASCSASTIDTKGIMWALQNCIKRALKKLDIEPNNCEIKLDGGLKAPEKYIHQKTIIKGDEKVQLISAASILAKVGRDKKMKKLGKKYTQYDFETHKGYGTVLHRNLISKHGLSDEHRMTYCTNVKIKRN